MAPASEQRDDGNRIQGNNVTGNDIGIRAEGTGNLIEANHVRNHAGPGIQVTTANGKNVIIRNVAGANVNSYSNIASGNQVGRSTRISRRTSPSPICRINPETFAAVFCSNR
jgi:hypothetical protein